MAMLNNQRVSFPQNPAIPLEDSHGIVNLPAADPGQHHVTPDVVSFNATARRVETDASDMDRRVTMGFNTKSWSDLDDLGYPY